MNERLLLDKIADGDEAALEALYTSYYPRLGRFLTRLTHNQALLEEAINDVFLVIWQSAGRYRGDASPSTWIMGIAYKKTLKMLQKENRATKSANAQPAEFESLHRHLELESAVAMLPDSQQAVVVLAYEFGYSYREIGDILNCPENTVKTRMFTARKALKSLLEA